ncbi:hypothetical protein [Pseudomonas sp. OST1909]|uniref:hypothetical protein n=1 Tax=Pseudomonas sp. OST1909 TaxID=2777367 RepID=UPI001886ECCF|nr:hypothetical protein [Pseudomonas sp. OST1909]QOY73822.1 hypothetical protein IH404_12455 [Pseudomonas sp. OST1909]
MLNPTTHAESHWYNRPFHTPKPDRPPHQAPAIEPATTFPAVDSEKRAIAPKTFKQGFGDRHDLQLLATKLAAIAPQLDVNTTPQAILVTLRAPLDIHPDSSFPMRPSEGATLESFIRAKGWSIPTTKLSLIELINTVKQQALAQPLGDFGGALSWSTPLSQAEQSRLRIISMRSDYQNALEALLAEHPLPTEVHSDPAQALEALLNGAAGQTLGKYLQEQSGGIATANSATDYLMAAIHLQLDPESITAPHRHKVAGFDLAHENHWGKPASSVLDALSKYLIDSARISPALSKVGAYALLARKAPVYLIKDIPATVRPGSPAWLNLVIAAAAIEAGTPGKVPNMTYVQVMQEGERARLAQPEAAERARTAALVDWGVCHNVIARKDDTQYSLQELESLKTTFTQRQQDMLAASRALDMELPTREKMAMAVLVERYGDLGDLFRQKLIKTTNTPRTGQNKAHTWLYGRHSMLDIAMMDLRLPYLFESADKRVPIKDLNARYRFDVSGNFEKRFEETIKQKKVALGTTVKHLIAQLPLEDRKNFEYGKITYYRNSSTELGFWSKSNPVYEKNLLVKIERNGQTTGYCIDLTQGAIVPVERWAVKERESRDAGNVELKTNVFVPTSVSASHASERTTGAAMDSFATTRTQHIADAFVEHFNLDDPDMEKYARGQTTQDLANEKANQVNDFFMNLIPFRSAIENFKKGNTLEGGFDLALDVFGFLTAGAATIGKLTNVAASAASLVTKVARTGKVIGMVTLSNFNPLDGLADLAVGGTNLISKGLNRTTAWLANIRATDKSHDWLKTISQEHGSALLGSVKASGRTLESVAVYKNNQWHHYDPITRQPYGAPIKDFTPKLLATQGEIKGTFDEWITSWFNPTKPIPEAFNDAVADARSTAAGGAAFHQGYSTVDPTSLAGYSPDLGVTQLKKLATDSTASPSVLGSLSRRIDELEALPGRVKALYETLIPPRNLSPGNLPTAQQMQFEEALARGNPAGIEGFSPTMKKHQLRELILTPGLTPAEVGALFKHLQNQTIETSLAFSKKFSDDMTAAGATVVSMPQGYYLSQVNLPSDGDCAALSNAMALAILDDKQDTLIKNFFISMAHPKHPNTEAFRNSLERYQNTLRDDFHSGQLTHNATHEMIIADLAKATTSKALLISNPKHGVTAGVKVVDGQKTWFFYDPNLGLAKFPNEASMRSGMERALNSGQTSHLFQPLRRADGYTVSDFNELYLMSKTGSPLSVSGLYRAEIKLEQDAANGV